jgi:hypothetical protein
MGVPEHDHGAARAEVQGTRLPIGRRPRGARRPVTRVRPASQPAAREDDEQQRERAEAERQPQYIEITPELVVPAAPGNRTSRNALGKTSMVPWSRIAMNTLSRVLLKPQVKMNVTATIQNT